MMNEHRWWWVGLTVTLALFQVSAIVRALNISADLAAQVSLIVPLEVAAGGVWALLFAITAVNLVRRHQRAVRWAVWLTFGFVIYSAARLFMFTQADYDRNRLSFIVIVTVLLAALLVAYATQQTE